MNGTKQFHTLILSFLVFIFSSFQPVQARDNDALVLGAIVMAGAVTAGAIVAAGFFGRSDRNIQKKAEDSIHQIYADFGRSIDALEQSVGLDLSEHISSSKFYTIPESKLCYLAQLIDIQSDSMLHSVTNQVRRTLDRANKINAKLRKRMNKLSLHSPEFNAVCNLSEQRLEPAIRKLDNLWSFLTSECAKYCVLSTIERTIGVRYARECNAIAQLHQDRAFVERELRAAVMNYGSQKRSTYPFLSYVDAIESDKSMLNNYLNGIGYHYPAKINACRSLCVSLDMIKSEVMINPQYAQSLKDREQARLERERLAMQRELQRQQQAIQAQQAALIAQNAAMLYEMSRPKPTVVVHEYVAVPAKPVIVHHVHPEPVIVVEKPTYIFDHNGEPEVTIEIYND